MKKKELALQIAELREDLAYVKNHLFIKCCPDLKDVDTTKQLEIGRWYKTPSACGLVYYQGENNGYGFNGYGDWEDNKGQWSFTSNPDVWTLASTEEVKSALVEEAKKRNLTPENLKNINCARGWNKASAHEMYDKIGTFNFESSHNRLWIKDGSYLDICVFDNGKWAEIIEQPKSTTIAVRCGVVSLEGVSFVDSYDEIAVQDVIDMYKAIQQLKGGDNA